MGIWWPIIGSEPDCRGKGSRFFSSLFEPQAEVTPPPFSPRFLQHYKMILQSPRISHKEPGGYCEQYGISDPHLGSLKII